MDAITCPQCGALNPPEATECTRCSAQLGSAQGLPGLEPGKIVFDRYKLDKRIGIGGMGEVWRAQHTGMNRTVALKYLHPHLHHHTGARERTLREARALAAVDHPNVIRIYDVFDEPPNIVLVLEYVDGGSLDDLVQTHGARPWQDCVHETVGMLKGLGAIHAADLIHRDIKPDNVLLAKSGESVVPKITDLGIAHFQEATRLTRGAIGTPEYMSPEQIMGHGIDIRSDLYSTGVMMYELLVGDIPFSGTDFEIQQGHVSGDLPLAKLPADIPTWLRSVLTRAMAKKPEERFANTAEFIQALEGQVEQSSPGQRASSVVTTPSTPSHPEQPSSRSKAPMLIALVVLAVVAIGSALFLTQGEKRESDAVSGDTSQSKNVTSNPSKTEAQAEKTSTRSPTGIGSPTKTNQQPALPNTNTVHADSGAASKTTPRQRPASPPPPKTTQAAVVPSVPKAPQINPAKETDIVPTPVTPTKLPVKIQGKITDKDGVPIARAEVATDPETDVVVSNAQGVFVLRQRITELGETEPIKTGRYRFTIRKFGFEELQFDVDVKEGRNKIKALRMRERTPEVEDIDPIQVPAKTAPRATHVVYNTYKSPKEPWLALKNGPKHGSAYQVIGQLLDGTKLRVLQNRIGYKRKWMEVLVMSGINKGRRGFVHGNWVKPIQ